MNAEHPVIYQQNGIDKQVSQDEAIFMLENIFRKDPQRALHHYLKLCNTNPNAEKLLWKFYETLQTAFMFEQLAEIAQARLKKSPNCTLSKSYLVQALELMFRNDKAIHTLEGFVKQNRSDAQSFISLGSLYKDIGEFDSASMCFKQGVGRWKQYEEQLSPLAEALKKHYL